MGLGSGSVPQTLHVKKRGRLGNQMFQYMLARTIASKVPGLVITGVSLPEWGVKTPRRQSDDDRILRVAGPHWLEPSPGQIISLLNTRQINDVVYGMFGMRMEYYTLPRASYRAMFGMDRPAFSFSDNELVIHVRAGDVLRGRHASYAPLPVGYYRARIAESGKRPVFIGEIHGEHFYHRALREAFPEAVFMPSDTPAADFLKLMSARHIVASTSSFCWLASWFSEAETIAFPVAGIQNPEQRPDIDLIPRDDPRYRFFSFPALKWSASEEQWRDILNGSDGYAEIEAPAPGRPHQGTGEAPGPTGAAIGTGHSS